MPPVVTINMRTPEGRVVAVPANEVAEARRQGYEIESTQEKEQRIEADVVADENDDIGDYVAAGAAGFARGATFGLSDAVVAGFGEAEDVEKLRQLQEAHPTLSTTSEIAGNVIPALGSGGGSLGLTPAGVVGRAGAGIIERGAARGGAAKVAAYLGSGALEGAAGGAGSYISDVALGRRDLSAEGFIAASGKGALFGAGVGGVALGIEKGAIAARRLFSKADVASEQALEAAEAAAARETDDVFASGDELAEKARDLVKQERLRKAQAAAAREEQKLAAQKALDEQKLTTQKALDDIRLEKARGGKPPRPAAAETPTGQALEAAQDLAPPPAAAPDAWTPQALDDSAALAEMLGQKPLRNVDAVEKKTAAFIAAQRDARDYVRSLRADLAKKEGGVFTTSTRSASRAERGAPSYTHGYRTKLPGRSFNEAGDEVALEMTDEVRAELLHSDYEALDRYEDLMNLAAVEADDAARESLLQQAADLEEETLKQLAELGGPTESDVLAARERTGITGLDIARKRAAERADLIAGMSEKDAAIYVTRGTPEPYQPKPRGERALDNDRFESLVRRTETSDRPVVGVDESGQPLRVGLGFEDSMKVPRFNRKPFADEAYEAYEILGNYEKAAADLVEELGDAAPPKMREVAEGYQKALGDQERKAVERSAQVADDAAAGVVDAPKAGKGKRGGKAAAAAKKSKPFLDKVADAAAAMEALQTAGVPGIPDVDRLPVIGPVLGIWLKTRAARKLLFGRDASKVAATGESRAAALAARVRDRAADAVDKLLAATPAAARKARGPVAMSGSKAVDYLRHQLFDDGEDRPESKDDVEATIARVDELANAVANQSAVKRAIRAALHDAQDPDLIREAEAVLGRKLAYLNDHAPKKPPETLLGRDGRWRPSKSEIQGFAERVKAAEDPATVLEDLAAGRLISEEAAETLRVVYPQLYAEASERLMARAAELEKELPYQRVLRLGILFAAPLVESLIPERIAALQAAGGSMAAGASELGASATMGSPSPAGLSRPPNLDSLYMTAADRRAQRR